MATGTISASLVVSFGDGDVDPTASLEVDGRDPPPSGAGFNLNGTDFKPGESAVLLAYGSPDTTFKEGLSSSPDATFVKGTTTSVEVEDTLIFADVNEAELSRFPVGGVSFNWLGTDLGPESVDGTTVTVTKGVGVCIATYNTTATKYTLTAPNDIDGETSFEIVCVVFAEYEK